MPQPRRTLQDIKTLAGRKTTPGDNQAAYLRMCTLEMERRRRSHEYKLAADRAEVAKRRVDQLTEQIRELMQSVSTSVGLETVDADAPRRSAPEPGYKSEIIVEHRYGAGRGGRPRKASITQTTNPTTTDGDHK
jgi:hypothetical protein